MNIPDSEHPRVVIVGGGFGGLNAAKKLKNKKVQIVLIDKHNYHTFQPLLYQVATAGLEPDSIAYPLRKVFKRYKNLFFRMAEVKGINAETKTIKTNIGELGYDYLILATGSNTNFFGIEGVERHALGMKEILEALDIRSLLLQNFEAALLTTNLEKRVALMSVAIVGGGATGVELAGALSELRKHVLPQDYPDLDVRRMNIYLIEAAPLVLSAMSEKASEKATEFLERLDIQLYLNTRVTDYDGRFISFADGRKLEAETLIWAAGVKGESIEGFMTDNLAPGSRYSVDEYNRLQGAEDIFVIGDVAAMISEDYPHGHAMMAQPAIQQGKNVAINILRMSQGKSPVPFKFKDLGSLATVGRNKAVADLPGIKLQGLSAWLIWMLVHIMQLVGFRNKVVVLLNWVYNYFIYARDIRLIIRPFKRK